MALRITNHEGAHAAAAILSALIPAVAHQERQEHSYSSMRATFEAIDELTEALTVYVKEGGRG